jgi:hypothetical protein
MAFLPLPGSPFRQADPRLMPTLVQRVASVNTARIVTHERLVCLSPGGPDE